ncbi:hypothetical protein LTS10_008379 [Elasticomyces elasticus]|nr:hypothetical protein LTS10_008379 [Elasticomyces elasticus]
MAGPSQKFGALSLGVFSVIMMGVWPYAAGTLGIGLGGGGVPVFLYGTLGSGVALSIFALLLAEWSSACPSRAGIVLVAIKIGGPRWGNMTGYFAGGFLALSGLFSPPALLVVTAQLCATIGVAAEPDWLPTKWQLFLIMQAFNLLTLLVIIYSVRIIDVLSSIGWCLRLQGTGVVLLATLFVMIGLLVGLSDSRNSSS